MHQVDAEQLDGGQQHRNKDQQQHRDVQEAAQHQKHQVDQQQEPDLRQLHAVDPLRHRLRNALGGEGIVEDERARQDDGDDGAGAGRFHHHAPEASPAQRTKYDRGQHQRVQCGDGGRFGGRENARVDAAEQHDRHGQRKRAAKDQAGPLGARHRFVARHVAPHGDGVDHQHHQRSHQEARNHAAQKQRADRRARNHGVDHHRYGRRDDRPQRRAGHHHRAGKATRVLGLLEHLANRHQAGTGSVGDRAAAHAREDHADQDVDLCQSAAHAADQDAAEIKQAFAHGTGVHDVGRKNEQRDGQQHIAVVQAVAYLFGDQSHVLPLDQQVGDAAGEHGEADRHAQQHAGDEHTNEHQDGRAHGKPFVLRAAAASAPGDGRLIPAAPPRVRCRAPRSRSPMRRAERARPSAARRAEIPT